MNAAVIWIGLPLASSILLLLIRKRQVLTTYLAAFLCLVLAFMAMVLPIGTLIKVGNLTMQIESSFAILGRRFIIDQGDAIILVLTYGMGAFWFFGGLAAKPRPIFVGIGLALLGMLIAAISVDPFLFSALLIEVVIIISVPFMGQPGEPVGKGIQRYLVFQTLGMPFILLAGWALGGSGLNLGDPNMILSATFLLGLGFAFLLAVFPFYSWIPLVADSVSPYISGFIFTALPVMILFVLLDFINGLAVIRESNLFFQALQFSGILMIVTGGIWAAFQRNLARLVGYAVIIETGFFLFAIGMQDHVGDEYFAFSLFPRMIALGLLALGMTLVKNSLGGLTEKNVTGLFKRMPASAGAVIIALFSLAGTPLLAEFSTKFGLLSRYASLESGKSGWIFLGMLGFYIAIFRFLAIFLGKAEKYEQIPEPRLAKGLILIGIISLFAMGLFPNFFLHGFAGVLQAFPNLQ